MKTVYLHIPQVSSTNDYAKNNLFPFASDLITIVWADEQTKGRGRSSRIWLSSPDDLTFSICFYLSTKTIDPLYLTMLTSRALNEVLREKGVLPTIKKPNDLFIKEKKIAGILTETTTFQKQTLVIIGIGLNVNSSKEFLATIPQPATSLFAETGKRYDRKALLHEIGNAIRQVLTVMIVP